MNTLKLSTLPKTWIIDLDGTIFKHNGYLKEREEIPLPGVKQIFAQLSYDDYVIITTSRPEKFRQITERNLNKTGIRYNLLLMGLPIGERILINDVKLSGLKTSYAINLKRNQGMAKLIIQYQENL